MKRKNVQKLHHGLYKVYWKSGGYSLAAVGSMPSGDRWLAPTNWVGGVGSSGRNVWKRVASVKIIKEI